MAMLREPDAAPAAGGGTARLLIPDQSLCVTCNVNPRHAACVSAGKVKRNKPLSPEGQARDRERRRSPEYLAKNLEAAVAWQARNRIAVQARKAVSKAARDGKLTPAKTCQVLECQKRSGLCGHHNSYAKRNHTRVVWLCKAHHQSVHSGMRFKLKAAAVYRTAFAPETA